MLQRGPGVLHHDVPEGDSVAALPAALAPHVEQVAPAPVVPLGPRVHHRAVQLESKVHTKVRNHGEGPYIRDWHSVLIVS